MADKTLEELRIEFSKISRENQAAYDAFNQRGYTSDGRSLKVAYATAVRDKDEKEIAILKPLLEAAQTKYKETQTRKNELNKQIKAAEKVEKQTKTKEKTVAAAADTYKTALDKLATAEIGLSGYKGEENYKTAYTEARNAYQAAVDAGKVPATPLPEAKIIVPVAEKTPDVKVDANGKPIETPLEPTIGEILNTLADPANNTNLVNVQKDLKANFSKFYKGGTGGIADWASTQDAITNILNERSKLPASLKDVDFITFIKDPKNAQLIVTSGTGTGNVPTAIISDPTEAAYYVRSTFKSVLQRDPTEDEIAKYSNILNKAQRKNLKKTVNGVTTGGLGSPSEFLTQEIQKLPEFTTKKKDKDALVTQDLQSIAKANGVVLGADQLASYANDIRNGKDVNVIKNDIRNAAGYGMPDSVKKMLANGTDLETIYAPYKTTMASLLEIPSANIDLNDSVLRGAIGPDKEMPLYEFRKALKKDPRWQYTNNARTEVSDKVLRVLQDFGFQA